MQARTPVISHDGGNLAAALQTILEMKDSGAVAASIESAFPGASVGIVTQPDGRLAIEFHQNGLLRPLSGSELSDGTLRYLLWVAALLTPRPPSMMVLNEPETSLHPDLLPSLAGLIIKAAETTRVWVVTHSPTFITSLRGHAGVHFIELQKDLGQTHVKGQSLLDLSPWRWVD